MKTKLIIGFIAVAVAALAGWNINKSQNEAFLSELALANVEALASGEIVIECDNSSMAIRCQKTCLSCGTVWTAIGGYGLSGKMKRQCTCGALYF